MSDPALDLIALEYSERPLEDEESEKRAVQQPASPASLTDLITQEYSQRPLETQGDIPTPEGEAVTSLADVGSALASGIYTGLTGIAAAPLAMLDPFAPIKRKYGLETQAEETQRVIGAGAESLGIDISPREGGLPRVVQKVAEESSASAIPAAMIFRNARRAHASGRQLHRFVAPFVKATAEHPVGYWIAEEAAATGAGVARSLAPETPWSQFGSGVAGAFTPAVAVSPLRLVKRLFFFPAKFSPASKIERGEAMAARRAQAAVGSDRESVVKEITEAQELFAETPGSSLTSAQASPALSELQISEASPLTRRTIAGKTTATNEALINELAALNRLEQGDGSVVARVVESSPPPSYLDAVNADVSARSAILTEGMDDEIAKAQSRIQTRLDEAARAGKTTTTSIEARRILEQESKAVFSGLEEEYSKLDDLGDSIGAEFNTASVKEGLVRAKRITTKAEKDLLPKDLMNTVEGFMEWESFRELRGLNRRLNAEIREAYGTPRGRAIIKALEEIKRGVDRTLDMIEEAPATVGRIKSAKPRITGRSPAVRKPMTPAMAEGLEQLSIGFRDVNRQFGDAAEKFRKGVTGLVLEPRRNPPAASETLGLYFHGRKGSREAALAWKSATESIPEAAQLMEDFIINSAIDFANDPRVGFSASRLARWRNNHRVALREFPEAAEKVESIERLQRFADDLEIKKRTTLDAFQKTASAQLVSKTPAAAVNSIIKSSNPARVALELKRELSGDPDAIAGLGRFLMSEFQKRATTRGDIGAGVSLWLDPVKFQDLLSEWAPVIRVFYGDEHVRNLQKVARKAEIAQRGPHLSQARRHEEKSLLEGVPLGWIWSRIYRRTTRSIRAGMAGWKLMENMDVAQSQALLEEAIVNPDVMKTLLTKVTPDNSTRIIKRLRTHLWTMGYRTREQIERDEENK